MMLIGITGNFGSGKSTVARMLRKISNGYLIDADKIARRLVEKKLRASIIKEFGTIKRKKLAELVFSDKKALKKLNTLVHPQVKKELSNKLRQSKKPLVIIDAHLLIEAGIHTDKVIVVKTDKVRRLARLKKSFRNRDIKKRDKAQMTIKRKLSCADFVVDNNRSLKNTENQVKKIWNKIRSEGGF